jgi:hypothetical protein
MIEPYLNIQMKQYMVGWCDTHHLLILDHKFKI